MGDTIAIFISIVSFGTVIFTFFRNNHKSSSADGERWGEIKATLDYIKGDINEIKEDLKNNTTILNAALDKHRNETSENIRRLHQRIDEHIATAHNFSAVGG